MNNLETTYKNSSTYEIINKLSTATKNSWLAQQIKTTPPSRNTRENSILLGLMEDLENPFRNSWLYGWLTKEPEPSVVVIDLRETLSVTPFLELLDNVLDSVVPAWISSWIHRLIDITLSHIEKAPVRVLSSILLAILTAYLVVGTATEMFSTTTMGFILLLALTFALTTRVTHSWNEIKQSPLLKHLLGPNPSNETNITDETQTGANESGGKKN